MLSNQLLGQVERKKVVHELASAIALVRCAFEMLQLKTPNRAAGEKFYKSAMKRLETIRHELRLGGLDEKQD